MKSLTRNGERLTLVLDNLPALRAGANAVKGARFLGVDDGHAVYDFPVDPFVAEELVMAFEPTIHGEVKSLLAQAAALRDAIHSKDGGPLISLPVKTTPYEHQVRAASFAMARWGAGAKGTALLMEQGTGKTLVAIALASMLEQLDRIDWVMTVCPNTLRGTWVDEIARHGNWPDDTHVLDGTRVQRAIQLDRLLRNHNAPWIITNYEQFAIGVVPGRGNGDQAKAFRSIVEAAKARPGLIILDESTYVKNMRAQRTRALAELAAAFPHRLILTGTPITRSPLDAFGQFEVMEKGCLGFNSYLAFERAYAVYQPQRIAGGRMIQVPASFQNLDDLERRLAALSFRARAADCLDLPPVIVRQVPVVLSGPQAIAYQQLTNDMMAELEGGNFLDGRNILSRYGKLAQVVGGHAHMVDADGRPAGVKTFDPNPKLDALMEYLEILFEDPDAKAVVFCEYVAEVKQILDETYRWSPAAMYGDVHPKMRDVGLKRFTEDSTCRLMVNQYQCGSIGLNLTAANTTVFYSLSFSLLDYLQAQKRVHRSGQTADHVNEVYLVAQRRNKRGELRPTIDNTILEALRGKKDLADIVTGDRARAALEEIAAL